MNNKKSIITLLLVAIIGIVGLTVAYFSSSASIENTFETSEYGVDAIETFTSPTGWQPGDETPKVLTVKNTGSVDEAVRVKVEESWKSKNNTDLPLTQGNNVAAIINFANTDDWTKVVENNKTYYYYNYKLAPTESTSTLLNSVTFNPLITNDTNCDESEANGVKTVTCSSTGDGYDGATYTLNFKIETVQYDKYQEAWNTNVSIAEEKPHPGTLTLLEKKNPISITNYTDGNIHEMYTFEHAATAQTPALTDYRYIGKDPNNYVYFNCDDPVEGEEYSYSDACEVWRILGVYDVERKVSSKYVTERRMKLVRGYELPELMYWNSGGNSGYHAWANSSLRAFLNGDYYYRRGDAESYGLKASARRMVKSAKYYLGTSNSAAGSVESIYNWERGSVVCGGCGNDPDKLYWNGVVGLMYPSDQFMVYAKGVSASCYNSPSGCSGDNAKTGWVLNSNKIVGNVNYITTWFISSTSVGNINVFYSKLNLSNDYRSYVYDYTYGVRPVLYLDASVEIIDGDGSSNNPYKLK